MPGLLASEKPVSDYMKIGPSDPGRYHNPPFLSLYLKCLAEAQKCTDAGV